MTPALAKFYRFIIAVSLLVSVNATAHDKPTTIGRNLQPLLGIPYEAFATRDIMESRSGASCISVVTYGLRSLGHNCGYWGFRQYFDSMRPQAHLLELGKTSFPEGGAILFDRTHFTVTYRDKDQNGLIGDQDEIIHAPFAPVEISSIASWLNGRKHPIYVVNIGPGLQCPKAITK